MQRLIPAFLIGIVFGLGIVISGMANPSKVVNFFDFAGTWDPSLAFVMGGALIVTFAGYRLILGRPHPVFDTRFHLPSARSVDARLVGGATLFGIGWGMAGFCPGGALPVVGTAHTDVLLFVAALVAGIFTAQWMHRLAEKTPATSQSMRQ